MIGNMSILEQESRTTFQDLILVLIEKFPFSPDLEIVVLFSESNTVEKYRTDITNPM